MEPKAKRSKLDDGVFVLNRLKGRVVLRIDGISKFLKTTRGCCSEPMHIRGFDWFLYVWPFSSPNNGLEFYIQCNGGFRGPKLNCAASVILLCTSGGKEVDLWREDDIKFDETTTLREICGVSIEALQYF